MHIVCAYRWLTSALVCASQHSEVSGSFATAITERESTLDLVLVSLCFPGKLTFTSSLPCG